jgi:HJR/Mrr/RecB family endonuclease
MILRLLRKFVLKLVTLVITVIVMGAVMRYGQRYVLQASGLPPGSAGIADAKFSSDEADLMGTVFKSALRLFTGQASRNQLSGELSDKLYAGRDPAVMKELGIELVKPGDDQSGAAGVAGAANSPPGAQSPAAPGTPAGQSAAKAAGPTGQPTAKQAVPTGQSSTKQGMPSLELPAVPHPSDGQTAMLDKIWTATKANSTELGLIPVVILGMVLVNRIRQRRSSMDDIVPQVLIQTPADTEPFEMTHAAHSLGSEDFELLVALIYQRQGYRVLMPSAQSGGRGGDFTLARKAERILVQCKRLNQDHKVPVDRVRELQEAVATTGATRGMYVATCAFSWDARNFAKTKGMTLISARTLDALITAAREQPDENLLNVSQWAPKLVSKVQFTTPQCPSCEAPMDQISANDSSGWLCSQRPECRGRRGGRKYQKLVPAAAAVRNTEKHLEGVTA